MILQPAPDVRHLADLHAQAFDTPWSSDALEALMASPGVASLAADDGFVLVRTVADEAEILTLAVRPPARRRGLGRRLVEAAATTARTAGASRLFLEVAEDNAAARALYAGLGFVEAGRRTGYYARPDGARATALLLALNLTDPLP